MRIAFAAAASLTLPFIIASPVEAQQTLPEVTITAPKKAPAAPKKKQSSGQGGQSAPLAKAPQEASPYGSGQLVGEAQSGSEDVVTRERLQAEPVYRTGEMLEAVPGLVVTQHSGEGKANQYFLRGFNLDHGTDLAITIDGMPVNMRTHGHGQGYADTNFMIPEIMRGLIYRKGPYFASEGDFASAGAIHLDVVDRLDKNFAQVEVGSFGHRRAVTAMSVPTGLTGTLLVAGEIVRFDGPWDRPDDLRKLNGVMRYSQGSYNNGFSITGMAYTGQWFATDQIPKRTVSNGDIGLYGTLDPTDGGEATRFSLSGRWSEKDESSHTQANAYLVRSRLALFNNFTYLLDADPVGDQFKQSDSRWIAGAAASKTLFGNVGGMRSDTTLGVQTRYDDMNVGLAKSEKRIVYDTVRQDHVREFSIGVYGENTLRWTPWLRTTAGLRADLYSADVSSNLLPANSGSDLDTMLSPKLGLVLGPWSHTELYMNAGTGFHSNDARGTTIKIDPTSGDSADRIPFLVRSKGAEIGLRSQPSKAFQSTLAAFVLEFDSEIVFVGDAGNTEASRSSRRIGLEYTLQMKLLPWLMFDFEAAYTRARFTEDDPLSPVGSYIPGATEGVVSAGLTFGDPAASGWFGGVKVRYFGPRPLIEDNSVRSKSSSPVSARLGYMFADGLMVRLDGFNLFDQKSSQIDYYYGSRILSDGAPVGTETPDIHFHPLEPRSVRLSVAKQW
jgi:hypothetical protein